MTKQFEKALLKAVGQKSKLRKESDQVYRARVARAGSELGDSEFYELPGEQQDWVNDGCAAINSHDDIRDFTPIEKKVKAALKVKRKKRLWLPPDKRLRDTAACVRLILKFGFRPGGTDTGTLFKSYGAMTLEGRHVFVNSKGQVILRFVPGQSHGVKKKFLIDDNVVAQDLVERAAMVGKRGRLFAGTNAGRIRKYVKELFGDDEVQTKNLRTLEANRVAEIEVDKKFEQVGRPAKDEKEFNRWKMAIAVTVSKRLGIAPRGALKADIDPTRFDKLLHTFAGKAREVAPPKARQRP